MGEAALDRIIFGLITLPFVIFAFVRIFIRENRRNDELFYDRAKTEIAALREHCDLLSRRLDERDDEYDRLEQALRRERHLRAQLEDEVRMLKAQLGIRTDPKEESL